MTTYKPRKHVYGPVPSRRLGLSLGVDLVPYKVCCYDCVYCQLGPTSRLTVEREAFVDPDQVAREVEQALERGPRPQVITLAGSGEPTLHAGLGEVVQALRRVSDLPLCLLTNGGLLWQEPVARAAAAFDMVAPSLDAADPETFRRVNRPAGEIDFAAMLDGLRRFCAGFTGRCQLEVLLVRGVNDAPESLDALARVAGELRLDSVDLNTVVRPPAVCGVRGLDAAQLERARERFGPRARVVASFREEPGKTAAKGPATARPRILETVARRPCTIADLVAALGLDEETVRAVCASGVEQGELREERVGEATYYRRP